MRPTDIFPAFLIKELLRLHKINPNWCIYEDLDDGTYRASSTVSTPLQALWKTGADAWAMLAASTWLGNGPKIFKPTKEQCAAMEHISVNLSLEDYSQPYPVILIELDYPPFNSALCYLGERLLVCVLHSTNHENDITTTIGGKGYTGIIEDSLILFDEDCAVEAPIASRALRVACNSCLALSHFGNHINYLFPVEVSRDRNLSREREEGRPTERAAKAMSRIPLAVQVLTFSQEVILHRVAKARTEGEPTGRIMPPHFRSGHWAMQPYGPKHSLRKRILRPAVMVRAELFVGELSNTEAIYST